MTASVSRRHVAVGDPQAPFATFLFILRVHRLLTPQDRLKDEVHLVSMGDHFDWGKVHERERARADGLRILEWLADHSEEQVTLLLGNHDLARVSELAEFDDASFAEAQRLADAAYHGDENASTAEAELLKQFPHVASAESVARDFSTFSTAQRALVVELLRAGRFRLAHEHRGLLLAHAGITGADLKAIGAPATTALDAADALRTFLEGRVQAWKGGALELAPLQRAASSTLGESRGALHQRPADPQHVARDEFSGPPRRRYDPRDLPAIFAQVIGHVRDAKCRELMPTWHSAAPGSDGPCRGLCIDGKEVHYAHGTPANARLYFIDNGMAHAVPKEYELFDLDARRALRASMR